MAKPVWLVEAVTSSSALRVNLEGLSFLRSLAGPVHVVAIFGPKETGKSFLIDHLAGEEKGFRPMPGIWLQCLDHPKKPGESLVLLDTEGLPEHMEEDESIFFQLFLLNVLLSNVFIYNTRGVGDLQKELNRLKYVMKLPDKVHVLEDCSAENRFLLSGILPEFAWCLRDVPSDSCWEEMLQATDHHMNILLSCSAASEDTATHCIQELFPSRTAFCFHSPHVDGKDGEIFSSDLLHPVFRRQLGLFKEHVLSKEPKRSLGSTFVNGEVLSGLLEQFVAALSRGEPIRLNDICDGPQAEFVWVPQHSRSPSCAVPRATQPGIMEGPLCLIENRPGEMLQVNREALSILESIQQPLVVVAIVGLYRTGKSYLMNKLAGKDKGGFSLGATIQANTKGIWMWCIPHPEKPDHTLVLLDTEGLGDVQKSNTENDSLIFALSILLSSTFVYNSKGTIDQFALEQLHYVTELTEHIKVKAPARQSRETDDGVPNDFSWFFPTFIWVVRDFTLQLELEDGSPISEDEYLERALQRKKDAPEKQDLAKKCLRQYFPNRKCFVLECPASREELKHLEELPEEKLNPEFLQQARCFCRYIFESAQAKMFQGGHVVTGTLLGRLAVTYVDAIRSGAIPCIENAVLALAQIENSAAKEGALKRYEAMVELLSTLPTESIEELLRMHAECEAEAIQVFLTCSFKDEDQKCQRELGEQLHLKLEELCRRNEQASLDRCQAALMELFQELEEKISDGSYSVPGGYQKFLDDQREKLEQYHLVPEKGLMASEALQEFLKSKEPVAKSILQADRTLTDKEKEAEAERVRAKALEQEAQLQKKMKEEAEQMILQNQRSYKEHERQLVAKMEVDKQRLLADQERMLSQKLQEQARLQTEGFRQEVSRLQGEIQGLRHQMNQQRGGGDRRRKCVIC